MLSVADQTESLLKDTRVLLENRGELTLREIAGAANVEFEWLKKLVYSDIRRPNVERVERVHRYLTDYNTAQRFGRIAEARAS